MMRVFAILALALMLAALPACVSASAPAAQSADQKAYALIGAYGLALAAATALAQNPATPAALRQDLARAEAVATPAVELVKITVVAADRAAPGDQAARAAALSQAIADAVEPVAALAALAGR
jgi:hypothetical protein